MADQSIGDVARHSTHPLPHRRRVDRDAIADRLVGPDPSLDVDVDVFALVADRLPGGRLLHDQPGRLDDLTEMRRGLSVVDGVPGLVQPADAGPEAEPEAAVRHLVDVERGDGEDERAPREGPGYARADVDLLGL